MGACRFDLAKFIDKGARTVKACMIQPGEEPQDQDQIVMRGNAQEHPDAFIIFRIFADTIEEKD